MAKEPTLIELSGVTISFPRGQQGALTVVEDMSLSVAANELHCLAGRSGSGKTSALRVAAGLARPAEGTVRWQGRDISDHSDDELCLLRRTQVGLCDQGGAMLGGLTALENVLVPAMPGRKAAGLTERARQLLARLGLADRLHHMPAALSGGESQRVALARAMLLEPAILIADEPTASLDRDMADLVVGLLCEYAAAGRAVLAASHDPHLVATAVSVTRLD